MVYTYIWGAGQLGLECLSRIKNIIAKHSTYYFCDNNPDKIGKELEDVPIIGLQDLKQALKKNLLHIILIAVKKTECDRVRAQLRDNGIDDNIVVTYNSILDFSNVLQRILGKPNLSYVETHVNDHCNLRCRGCGHLSNIAPPRYTDFKSYEADMKRLKTLFENINKIRLMGGEPFLNNNIYEFAALGREIFPHSDIRIATNGLLINENKIGLLSKLKELNIILDITNYPPTQIKRAEIEKALKQGGIKYRFTEEVKTFTRFRNINANKNINEAYANCTIKECHYLRDGKLSICTFPILYQQLDTFMKNLFEINEQDVIDIFDESVNGWEIALRLSAPIISCRYCCTDRIEPYKWEGFSEKNAKAEDWFVKI